MENNNYSDQTLILLKLFNVVKSIEEILVDKNVCTKEEFDLKVEEVGIKSGNTKIIERLEVMNNVYDILTKESCTIDDRQYVLDKCPGIYSDEDIQNILGEIGKKITKEEE
jgi:hypothetical protein